MTLESLGLAISRDKLKLRLPVDTAIFGGPLCGLFSEWIVGNLSWEFPLLISTPLHKTSLQSLLLGEFHFGFPLDDPRIRTIIECEHWANDYSFSDMILIMAVFIWFSALRYLISSFRDSTWWQSPTDWCFSSRYFFCNKHLLKEERF